MLENSLKIREKYVNKIKAKVDSLTESMHLLEKVDRQLMREQIQMGGARLEKMMKSYDNIQAGGAAPGGTSTSAIDFKAVQESALRKKAEILLQRKSIDELNANIAKLSAGFQPINDVLGNVKRLIDSISIDIPTLGKAKPPSIGDWSPLAQYNLYHNKAWAEIVNVTGLTAPNGEINFTVFNKTPDENKAVKGSQADRDAIKAHLVVQLGEENVTDIASMYSDSLVVVHGTNASKGSSSSGTGSSGTGSSGTGSSGAAGATDATAAAATAADAATAAAASSAAAGELPGQLTETPTNTAAAAAAAAEAGRSKYRFF